MQREKYVEGTRSIVEMGSERKSKMAVIPSEWFERLQKMEIPIPKKMRWILDNVGMVIPEGMSDTEALKHMVELLYNYYPKEFVDKVFKDVREKMKHE